jgi:hypothetical protein
MKTSSFFHSRFFPIGLVAALALSGCYGGDGDEPGSSKSNDTSGDAGEGGAAGSTANQSGGTSGKGGATTAVDCDERETEIVELAQTIWHSGFKVTLGTAVLTPSTPQCSNGELVIDAEFYNRGLDAWEFDTRLLLSSNGLDYGFSEYDSEIPLVEGDRTAKGALRFAVDEDFDLDQATLLIGDAGYHEAVIPIGASSPDALVTMEPQELPITGTIEAGVMGFAFQKVLLRADSPDDHAAHGKGVLELKLYVDMTYLEWTFGGLYVGDDGVLLRLPDGQSISPEYGFNEAFNNVGETAQDYLGFLIPTPAEGEYTLTVGGNWAAEGSDWTEAEFPFEIAPQQVFGE